MGGQVYETLTDQILAQGREEGREQGTLHTLLSLVRDGLLSPEEGAKRAGCSQEEFEKQLVKEEV